MSLFVSANAVYNWTWCYPIPMVTWLIIIMVQTQPANQLQYFFYSQIKLLCIHLFTFQPTCAHSINLFVLIKVQKQRQDQATVGWVLKAPYRSKVLDTGPIGQVVNPSMLIAHKIPDQLFSHSHYTNTNSITTENPYWIIMQSPWIALNVFRI